LQHGGTVHGAAACQNHAALEPPAVSYYKTAAAGGGVPAVSGGEEGFSCSEVPSFFAPGWIHNDATRSVTSSYPFASRKLVFESGG